MPRNPTHRSIVREIRNILGWTQTTLAKRLDTQPISINRIENGSLRISRKLALRLSWTTGVDYRDISQNKAGTPQTRLGPFSPQHLARLDQKAREITPKDQKTLVANAVYRAELLYQAAIRYAPHKLWSLTAAVEETFDELETEFQLRDRVRQIRQEPTDSAILEFLQKNFPLNGPAAKSASKPKRRIPAPDRSNAV